MVGTEAAGAQFFFLDFHFRGFNLQVLPERDWPVNFLGRFLQATVEDASVALVILYEILQVLEALLFNTHSSFCFDTQIPLLQLVDWVVVDNPARQADGQFVRRAVALVGGFVQHEAPGALYVFQDALRLGGREG